jgi:Tol biopolymer transport system component
MEKPMRKVPDLTVRASRRPRGHGSVWTAMLAVISTALVVMVPAAGYATRPGPRDRIAFHTDPESFGQVYTVDVRGKHRRQLTREGDALPAWHSRPVWSPHGKRLLYLRGVDDDGTQDVWLMGARGRHKKLLLRGGNVRDFMDMSWAPRARRIALVTVGFYSDRHDLAVFSMKTHKLTALHVFRSSRWNAVDVDWSPDGRRLVFSAWEDTGASPPPYDLFSIRPNGTDPRRLTATPEQSETGAVWSPNGTRLAYARFSNGCDSVVISAPNATHARKVPSRCSTHSPSWAPDGHRLVVGTSRSGYGGDNIVVMRLDGSHRKVVGRGFEPAWRPR